MFIFRVLFLARAMLFLEATVQIPPCAQRALRRGISLVALMVLPLTLAVDDQRYSAPECLVKMQVVTMQLEAAQQRYTQIKQEEAEREEAKRRAEQHEQAQRRRRLEHIRAVAAALEKNRASSETRATRRRTRLRNAPPVLNLVQERCTRGPAIVAKDDAFMPSGIIGALQRRIVVLGSTEAARGVDNSEQYQAKRLKTIISEYGSVKLPFVWHRQAHCPLYPNENLQSVNVHLGVSKYSHVRSVNVLLAALKQHGTACAACVH